MGRYVHNINCLPGNMITIEIHDPEDIEMLHLMLERLLQIHLTEEE